MNMSDAKKKSEDFITAASCGRFVLQAATAFRLRRLWSQLNSRRPYEWKELDKFIGPYSLQFRAALERRCGDPYGASTFTHRTLTGQTAVDHDVGVGTGGVGKGIRP